MILYAYCDVSFVRLAVSFPFQSYMGIQYEVGEILGTIRDLLLFNPKESLSVKQ